MWEVTPSDRYNWNELKDNIIKHGLKNSLLISPMPTASTSQIMGSNECFEPFTSNLYKRKTLAGEFIVVNKYLVNDLIKLGLWNSSVRDKIIHKEGSIQSIDEIPGEIKELYKTVWEIKQKNIIDQAADRGAFICQSQSMNLFMESPDFRKLSSMHFYSWTKGLKTGIYYLRSKAKAKTQQFTLDPKLTKLANISEEDQTTCISCNA
jgi:ribonucleoside-diphosphate reductase alpha chain